MKSPHNKHAKKEYICLAYRQREVDNEKTTMTTTTTLKKAQHVGICMYLYLLHNKYKNVCDIKLCLFVRKRALNINQI